MDSNTGRVEYGLMKTALPLKRVGMGEGESEREGERETRGVIGAGLWSASLGLAFNPNDHASRYSVWFPPDLNPQLGFSALSGISGWSAGVWVSMGAGHVMAYAAIGLR